MLVCLQWRDVRGERCRIRMAEWLVLAEAGSGGDIAQEHRLKIHSSLASYNQLYRNFDKIVLK